MLDLICSKRGSPKEREAAINLTREFTKAAQNLTDIQPVQKAENSETYRIYIGNKHIGMMNGRHLFLRVIDSEDKVLCDFHGVRHGAGDAAELVVMFEPHAYDYFDHLKSGSDHLIWEGDSARAGQLIRRATYLADMINQEPSTYALLSQNCNMVLQTMLRTMEIEGPQDPEGWTPGYEKFFDLGHRAREAADQHELHPAEWLSRFKNVVASFNGKFQDAITQIAAFDLSAK